MKKIALFVAAIAVSFSISGRVFADGENVSFKEKAGITPDNVILYPIDKAIDNLKVTLSSGDEAKVKVLVEIAIERLGESEVMADKEKTELSTEALKEYDNDITEAQQKLEDVASKTTEENDSDAQKINKLETLESNITEQQKKSLEILKSLEGKIPDKAKETISMVIEMQSAKKEAITAVLKERKLLLEDKKALSESKKKLEDAKKSGDEQAIKAAEDDLKKVEEAYTAQKDKLKIAVEDKKEIMKGGVGKLKKAAKEEIKKQSSNNDNAKQNAAGIKKTSETQNEQSNTATNTTAKTVTPPTSSQTKTPTVANYKDDEGKEEHDKNGGKEKKDKEQKHEKENEKSEQN